MHVSSAHLILEGRESSLLRTYCQSIRYPLEASSSLFSVTSQIPCQINQSLPSIAAIPVWYRALCCHLRKLGTTFFCDLLTCAPTATSHLHFLLLSMHQRWPDEDHHLTRAHLVPHHLQLPPLHYHRIQGTYDSCHRSLLLRCLPS